MTENHTPTPAPSAGIRSLLAVEERGIEPVPESEQNGHPRQLFWVWFAANISILGLPLGAWVVGGTLNIWQALLAAVIGAVGSFAIVGLVSIAGQRSGAPTLTLSRAVFGPLGNIGPTIVAILSRWGWETVNAVTACFAIVSIFTVLTGSSSNPKDVPVLAVATVVFFIVCTLLVSGLGHSVLLLVQQWATYVFGALTIAVVAFLLATVDWARVAQGTPGDAGAVLVAIGVVAAGTGIAWANSGADIARYQGRTIPGRRLMTASALGAGIPLVVMIATGSLITITNTSFDPNNPLSSIPQLLPSWMSVPFLIAAFAGLLLSNNISVYSSGLTILTLGIKARRIWAVGIDLMVSLIGSLIFLFFFEDFYGPFIGFIVLLSIPLTAWLGVFLIDMISRTRYHPQALLDLSPRGAYWYRGGVRIQALSSWVIAIIVGYFFSFPPLNESWIAANSLPWLVSVLVAAACYALLGGARRSKV